ncbi:sensor histidine kinase [Motiliproteus sediminis]|uniref:sensor histidine kinase n=1 Tax=Motiliproteus sediminis TaxID=1468178 RepID=UPI001AF011A8|nr:ATP-binding protein [Motiliproteus sediminis]
MTTLTSRTDSESAIAHRWRNLSLIGQFTLTSAVVLILGMALIGFWVTDQIKNGVMRNTASSTAMFMSSFIEPVVQELAHQDSLSPETHTLLDELLNGTDLSRRVLSFKVWKQDGLVVFSSRHELIGKRFPVTADLERAWRGEVSAEFDQLVDEENALERAEGVALLEVYSPIRQNRTGRIIAVAEFYEHAEELNSNLFWSTLTSWLVVGGVTLLMLGALSVIVLRGNRTIEQQRRALETQVADLSSLLNQNEELRSRLQRASRRTAEINERYLRRISADLHDGPAQLMAFALLRIDSLRRVVPQDESGTGLHDVDTLRQSLTDALNEVRAICTGLALPELRTLSPEQLLRNAASAHERSTGTEVEVTIESAPAWLSQPYKICAYRFVQETLSNAYHHANGEGQKVRMRCVSGLLEIEVSDSGPGLQRGSAPAGDHGLGLPGLRERIESLGGNMRILSSKGQGTRVMMTCEVTPQTDEEHP